MTFPVTDSIINFSCTCPLQNYLDFNDFLCNPNSIELYRYQLLSFMSITPKALPRMRIISIPLTRPRATLKNTIQNEPAKRILTYYQFQITSPPRPSKSASTSEDGEDSWMSRWRPEGGVVKWVTTKAADTWAGFGKEKAGWKVCFFLFYAFSALLNIRAPRF